MSAQSPALPVVSDDDGELAGLAILRRNVTCDPELYFMPIAPAYRNQRHVPVVVHPGEVRQHPRRQFAHAVHETEVARFAREVAHEFLLDTRVLGADRA